MVEGMLLGTQQLLAFIIGVGFTAEVVWILYMKSNYTSCFKDNQVLCNI